ncbi:unnamed protein product [Rotaria magnacalcarata]
MSSCDDISLSSSTCTTASCASSSSSEHSTHTIRQLLIEDEEHFEVIPNNHKRTTAACWKTFDFPAKKYNETSEKVVIPGFVSCKRCFYTYKYIDSSTTNLYSHGCCRNQSSDQTSITSFIQSPRSSCSSKISKKKKEELTKLCSRWVAGSMRPFQIVADPGFICIAQACINIGQVLES